MMMMIRMMMVMMVAMMVMMVMMVMIFLPPADPDSSGVCAALLTLCACLLILVSSYIANI